MESLENLIAEHPFFKGFEVQHIKLLTGCASNEKYNAGDFLFRQGEPANKFYIVRSGKVSVEVFIPQKGAVTIQTADEGEILGWSWLVKPYQWHFDARAMDLTRLIALDGECLRKKCGDDHNLGYELLKRFTDIMARRLEATRVQLMDIYGTYNEKTKK
jgi:CRP/FNR family transcriptional regulator, cyclic AMP receptor protein